MSKAFRGVRKTQQAPNRKAFNQVKPADLAERRKRLRSIAQGLQKTGPNLADAHPNKPIKEN